MCIHRKEVCSSCRSPVHDVIVICDEVKNRLAITKPGLYAGIHVLDYSYDNLQLVVSVFPHQVPTVERSSSLCRSHYMMSSMFANGFSYEDYRNKIDSWMQARR